VETCWRRTRGRAWARWGRTLGNVLVLALVTSVTANAAPATRVAAPGSFDHCLLGHWVMRASTVEKGDSSLIGTTVDVVRRPGLTDGAPAATMTFDLNRTPSVSLLNAHGTYALRGTATTIVTGRPGSIGVDSYAVHMFQLVNGHKEPASNILVLGISALYTCSISTFNVISTDDGLVEKATFRRS
jgi:hypothetical protein